jgi:Tol biopolymer transport system component
VWRRIVFCVVLGGCGFHSRAGLVGDLPPDGDAPGRDARGSDAPGGDAGAGSDAGSSGTTSCLQRWLDGGPGLALSQPTELALATTTDDRDPWISADGLRLYFSRNPGQQGGTDIYLTTRASTAVDFTIAGASAVVNLDTQDDESRAALSGDEKMVVFSGNHGTMNNNFQLFASRRGDPAQPFPSPGSPDQALVASVNTAGDNYFDPFLSRDGLRLYLAPILPGSPQQIRMATRMAVDRNFGPSAPVAMINSGSADADPALSLDERILVFSSLRPAGAGLGATNLWYATRPSATANFAAPKLIPTVNSDQSDGDPMLSADGCELYFASRRLGGGYRLFRAQVTQ